MSRGWKSGGDFPVRYGWKQNSNGKWYYSRKQQSSRFPWSAARAFSPDLDYELPLFRSFKNWREGKGWQPGYDRYDFDTAANRRFNRYTARQKAAWDRKTFHRTPYRQQVEYKGFNFWQGRPVYNITDKAGEYNSRGIHRSLAWKALKYQ